MHIEFVEVYLSTPEFSGCRLSCNCSQRITLKVHFDKLIKNSTPITVKHYLVCYVPVIIKILKKNNKSSPKNESITEYQP